MLRNLVFHCLFADNGKETFQTMEKRRSRKNDFPERSYQSQPDTQMHQKLFKQIKYEVLSLF